MREAKLSTAKRNVTAAKTPAKKSSAKTSAPTGAKSKKSGGKRRG
jgi:hypothetical protein